MNGGYYKRIDFRESKKLEDKIMKLGANDPKQKVIVYVKTVERDLREKVDGKPNKMFGKFIYKTDFSEEIFEATPEEVHTALMNGLKAAASKSK